MIILFFKNLEESSEYRNNTLYFQNELCNFSRRISYIFSRENDEDFKDVDLNFFNNF